MNRWLKRLGIATSVVVVVPVLFVASGYLLPADIELDLTHRVEAPPEAIFDLMSSYDGVTLWWKQANEDMGESFDVRHIEGPASGAGMHIGFAYPGGDSIEQWMYASLDPPHTLRMEVDFMGIMISHRTIELRPDGEGTLVHWNERGRVGSPLWRWMMRMFKSGAIENRRTALDSAGRVLRR